jgi:hypothetical protein
MSTTSCPHDQLLHQVALKLASSSIVAGALSKVRQVLESIAHIGASLALLSIASPSKPCNDRFLEAASSLHDFIVLLGSMIPSKITRPGGLMSQLVDLETLTASISEFLAADDVSFLSSLLRTLRELEVPDDRVVVIKSLRLCSVCIQPLCIIQPLSFTALFQIDEAVQQDLHVSCKFLTSKNIIQTPL